MIRCALMGLALVGCATGGPARVGAKSVDILADELRTAAANPRATLTAARTPLKFASGVVVTSCRDYLAQRRAHAVLDEGVANRMVASEYVLCDSVAALQGAALASADGDLAAKRGEVLASRLDLTSFPSSLGPRLDADHRVLRALGTPVRTTATEAVMDTADWTFRLRVVAVADFDHDGKTDWLVWLTDEARDGNYRDYRALVVPDVVGKPSLVAIPPP